MNVTRDLVLSFLASLFPPACLVCGRIEGIRSLPLALCVRCRDRLQPTGGPCRWVGSPLSVGRPSPGVGPAGPVTSAPAGVDRLLSGWWYAPPLDAVIHALKFARLEFLGRHLAEALHALHAEDLREVDVVVPVPLHWWRRARRGYNQAEAIAAPLARRIDRPLVRAVRRCRRTRPQARLARSQRATNLRWAFAPVSRAERHIGGQRVLLVDDVVTSGGTLEASAACLRTSGAAQVMALTAGRTPARWEF